MLTENFRVLRLYRKGKRIKNSPIPVYNAFIHWEAKINKKRMPVTRHPFINKKH